MLLWLSFALLLIAVGFIRARSAHADGDEIAAFTLIGLTGAIVGPVTATHELIWVLPAVLILVDAAARQRLARAPAAAGAAQPAPRRRLRGRGRPHLSAVRPRSGVDVDRRAGRGTATRWR